MQLTRLISARLEASSMLRSESDPISVLLKEHEDGGHSPPGVVHAFINLDPCAKLALRVAKAEAISRNNRALFARSNKYLGLDDAKGFLSFSQYISII